MNCHNCGVCFLILSDTDIFQELTAKECYLQLYQVQIN